MCPLTHSLTHSYCAALITFLPFFFCKQGGKGLFGLLLGRARSGGFSHSCLCCTGTLKLCCLWLLPFLYLSVPTGRQGAVWAAGLCPLRRLPSTINHPLTHACAVLCCLSLPQSLSPRTSTGRQGAVWSAGPRPLRWLLRHPGQAQGRADPAGRA